LADQEWPASVQWVSDSLFVGSDGKGHSSLFDSSADGPGLGMGPMTALLTTMGACSGMDVVALLKKRNQKLTSLKILLRGVRPESGHPRPYTAIEVKYLLAGTDLRKDFVEEAIKDSMEKFCNVAATLRPQVKITHLYEIA
jgi:putative redox protein